MRRRGDTETRRAELESILMGIEDPEHVRSVAHMTRAEVVADLLARRNGMGAAVEGDELARAPEDELRRLLRVLRRLSRP